ncbi:MAG: hypothetical protein OCD76_00750 [Reichenbachiella sp.]
MKDELLDEEMKEFDVWMKSLPLKKVGENFLPTVMASVALMQKRKRSMRLLIWTIAMLFSVIVLSFVLRPTMAVDLEMVPKIDFDGVKYFSTQLKLWLFDSTSVLFYVVVEAVLCLLIIDQVANYYRYIKRNVAQLKM